MTQSPSLCCKGDVQICSQSAELDIWQKKKDQYVDVRVSPSFFDTSLYDTIKETTIITVPSVEQLLKEERAYQQLSLEALSTSSPASLVNDPNSGLHSLYHSQASITSLLELFSTDYPDFARLDTIGQSAEGRDMHVLKVSDYRKRKPKSQQAEPTTWRTLSWKTLRQVWPDASLFKGKPKPKHKLGLALLGGQHAREWISPAVLLYIAHSFASTASKASLSSVHSWTDEEHEIMTLLSDYELHFIPLANPDGYVYAWDHDRLWVRSRQHIGSNETRCHGIDLNRNWGYKWERPYRPNPCSDLYPGAEAFESVENQAIKAYLEKVKSATRMDVFVDIHSFGQMSAYFDVRLMRYFGQH